MDEFAFCLLPFAPFPEPADLEIQGAIARQHHHLTLSYQLRGNLAGVVIPPPSENPSRQHNLWEETCFEFFLGMPDSPRYWEFNLSPAGHWNVYHFTDYRQGMEEETAWNSLPFRVQIEPDSISLTLTLDLGAIAIAERPVEVAITTVLRHRDGQMTYWALIHPGSQADFHRRDSFILGM
jgi:hypothetical protein